MNRKILGFVTFIIVSLFSCNNTERDKRPKQKSDFCIQGFCFKDSAKLISDRADFLDNGEDSLYGPIIRVYDINHEDSLYLVTESINKGYKRLPIKEYKFPMIKSSDLDSSDMGFYHYSEKGVGYGIQLKIVNITRKKFVYFQFGI